MFRDRDGWRVSWYVSGKKRSRMFADKNEASLFELQLKMGIADTAPSSRLSPPFSDFALRWLRDYCQVEKAETQWLDDASVIRQHLEPAFGRIRIAHLRKSHLLDLKAALRTKRRPTKAAKAKSKEPAKPGKTLSIRTVNNAIALAKKMMATAVDWEIIGDNPFSTVKLFKQPKQLADFWMPAERDIFLEAARLLDPEFTDLVLVAVHTGLRLGELAALQRKDLDFERKRIKVRSSYSVKLGKRLETVKGKEASEIEMNSSVYQALSLKRFAQADDDVFPKALFLNCRRTFRRLCTLTGVRAIRFHDLRHTFASHLAMAGIDLMQIQRRLRHKSYQMTLRYAHLHPNHGDGVLEVLVSGSQMARKKTRGSKSGAARQT